MRRASPFVSGINAVAPIVPGVASFGLIAGVAAVEAGLDHLQAYALSPIVFAGAAQLAIIDLIGQDAASVVIVVTALVINSRMLMYSAALAPWLRGTGLWTRSGVAYLLTDQAFAVSVVRYADVEERQRDRVAFYVGAGLAMWVTWQITTLIGVVVGAEIPAAWELDFAIPLVFLALLVPAVRDRPALIAAAVAAGVSVAAVDLSYNLGLPIAAIAGIAAGLLTPTRKTT